MKESRKDGDGGDASTGDLGKGLADAGDGGEDGAGGEPANCESVEELGLGEESVNSEYGGHRAPSVRVPAQALTPELIQPWSLFAPCQAELHDRGNSGVAGRDRAEDRRFSPVVPSTSRRWRQQMEPISLDAARGHQVASGTID